jgi:hypothetical protein
MDVPESSPDLFQPVPSPAAKPKVSKPATVKPGTGSLGRIFLASRPPGANVLVDGKPMNFQTPHWLEVPSGPHTITPQKREKRWKKSSISIREKTNPLISF